MRFGFFIPQGWRLDLVGIDVDKHWAVMRDLAAYADDSAWDSVWVYDHFHTVPMPTDEATHEAWSLMSAYAATTSRVKLGQMCTAMSYRNPVYLAKVAATADIISGGRIQMGIGGGWYEHEWRAYGYGFPSAGVRLGRLDEGVQIMRDAWRDGKVSFTGKHYQVDGAIVAPKPLQDNGIPLWIAGGGEKKTLRIAAKYAQYTNFTGEPAGVRAQVRGAGRSLPRRGHRLRRHRSLGQLQRHRRHLGKRRQRSAAAHPRSPGRLCAGVGGGRDGRRKQRPGFGDRHTEQVVERLRRSCATSAASTRSATSPRPHTTVPASSSSNAK